MPNLSTLAMVLTAYGIEFEDVKGPFIEFAGPDAAYLISPVAGDEPGYFVYRRATGERAQLVLPEGTSASTIALFLIGVQARGGYR